jgi:hypothetical protein
MKLRLVLTLTIAGLFVAAPVSAAPLVHEHYSGTDSFDFDDCGFTIHDDVVFNGLFMLKAGKHGDPTPRLSDNYEAHERLSANGKFLTIDHNGLYKDLHVTHIEGTIYEFVAMEVGRPFTLRDMNGKVVLKDRGRLLTTFRVDTLGDSDLDNDVFVDGSFSLLRDSGSHPAFYLDFCEIVVPLLS